MRICYSYQLWQNISMDPIEGNNKKHQTYWNRVAAYYDGNKSFSSVRTSNSLSHWWSAINTSVSKFIGYYNQIQRRNQSGLCEEDKEHQAMEMYSSLQKKTFQLVHCWKALRNCPKFGATIRKKTLSKRNETIQQLAELEKERLRAAEERERAREEREKAKEELDKQMYEISILGIDTSNMEAALAEYYNTLKANILNKKM